MDKETKKRKRGAARRGAGGETEMRTRFDPTTTRGGDFGRAARGARARARARAGGAHRARAPGWTSDGPGWSSRCRAGDPEEG